MQLIELHNDKEYFQACQVLEILNISNKESEKKKKNN